MTKMPMRANFEDIDTNQWRATEELVGFLTEMNAVEATYKSLEIPVPIHFAQKREELVAAIRTSYRVDMLKEVLTIENKIARLKTVKEQRTDAESHVAALKRRLGIGTPEDTAPLQIEK